MLEEEANLSLGPSGLKNRGYEVLYRRKRKGLKEKVMTQYIKVLEYTMSNRRCLHIHRYNLNNNSMYQVLSILYMQTLTGPLMVPEASRSPGLMLQPPTE